MKKYEIMIKKGREMLVQDFNFKQVIDFFHETKGNIKKCEHKNNLTFIPISIDFNQEKDEGQYQKNEEAQKKSKFLNDNP